MTRELEPHGTLDIKNQTRVLENAGSSKRLQVTQKKCTCISTSQVVGMDKPGSALPRIVSYRNTPAFSVTAPENTANTGDI